MPDNPYETIKLVNEYLLFHYGEDSEILPYAEGPHQALRFAERCVTEMIPGVDLPSGARALDLGCAVGRSSFTLSARCDEVIGIDYSQAFIDAATTLGRQGILNYERVDEGRITTALTARLPEGARPEKVQFFQGDAMDLAHDLGTFDLTLLANLICRLPHPRRCLDRLPQLVRPSGHLIITSPYTWLDDFTPPENWLGGFSREGEGPLVTLAALKNELDPAFEFVRCRDLPFLIREHARKFQWSVAEGSLWRRRLD